MDFLYLDSCAVTTEEVNDNTVVRNVLGYSQGEDVVGTPKRGMHAVRLTPKTPLRSQAFREVFDVIDV